METTTELWAFFRGEFVPLREANINVMTHGFNYGTAVFEGIRAYWNAEEEQLFGLELVPHFERIHRSAALLHDGGPPDRPRSSPRSPSSSFVATGCARTSTSGRSSTRAPRSIGVRLHNLDADITIFGVPFGQYIDTEGGIRAQVSSWRRTDDNAIPARGKITGAYVNGALAKSEAQLNGFDEAIVLTADGHVSEGSAENLFIVKDGVLHHATDHRQHPRGHHARSLHRDRAATTSDARWTCARIDRTELYTADEVFLCGTGRPDQPGHRDRPAARSDRGGPGR